MSADPAAARSSSPGPRRPWGALGLLGVAVAVALAAPSLMLRAGEGAAARARTAPDLATRQEARNRAAEWFGMLQASPVRGEDGRRAQQALTREIQADFEAQRRSLAEGEAGARAHLAWLDGQQAERDPAEPPVEPERIRALVSYGRAQQIAPVGIDSPPFVETWAGLAALWTGRLDAVPPAVQERTPGLSLRRPHQGTPAETRPPPPPGVQGLAEASPGLSRLVQAEAARRGGDPLEARRLLAPLVEALEPDQQPLAAAGAWSWGQSLLDELGASPAGAMLTGLSPQAEPRALSALRARLAMAPQDEPAWAGAWLVLSAIDARLGRTDDAVTSAWAAVAAATAAWAPDPRDLAAQARLDAPGALHPDQVQSARLALAEARLRAPPEEQAELAMAEAALLALQARGYIAAGDLTAARGRLELAEERVPHSPVITGWRVLVEVLDDRPDAARQALARLPDLPDTPDDDALRAAVAPWLDPPSASAVADPARALRVRLREPWDPIEPLAFARAHADRPDDLLLALASPPEDRASLAQAHAQAALRVRVARALDLPQALADATVTRDALAAAAQAEPLWALFALGAFTIEGPALPASQPDQIPR